jgi:hypothetical protein
MRNACKDAGGRILKNALLRGTISSSRENVKKTARDRVSNDYGPSRVGRTAVSAGRSPINLLCFMESEDLTGEKRRAQRSQRNTRVICTSVEV